jgi:hypothetical protein
MWIRPKMRSTANPIESRRFAGDFLLPYSRQRTILQPMQDFAETYRAASGDEIARLHGQIESLTAPARESSLVEIARRNLTDSQLAQTREQLTQHAESVNQEWQEWRREDAARTLRRNAIRIALVIAIAILSALFALNRAAH